MSEVNSNNGTQKEPTYQGIPIEKIAEAATIYAAEIPVRVQRREINGARFGSVGMFHMTLEQLAKIDEFVREKCGGGLFLIDPRDPNNIMQRAHPIPAFNLQIEGIPKPATGSDYGGAKKLGARLIETAMAQHGGDVAMEENPTPEEFANLPFYMKSYPYAAQVSFIMQQRAGRARLPEELFPGARPATTYTSDTAMEKHAQYVAADLATERAKHAAETAELKATIKELMGRIENSERERARIDAEAREREWKAHLAALEAKLVSTSASKPTSTFLTPEVLGIFVPAITGLFSTILTNGAQKQQTLSEQQLNLTKMQMDNVSAVLNKAATPPPDPFKGLVEFVIKAGPVLGPFVKQWFENRSPAAQSKVVNDLLSQQFDALGMIADMTEKLAMANGGQEAWYMPMIQQTIGGIVELVQNATTAHKQATQPVQRVPQMAQTTAQSGAGPAPATQQQQQQRTQGQQVAVLIMQHPQFPADMKSETWFHILAGLHDHQDTQQMAEFILKHCLSLQEKGQLPKVLAEKWDRNPVEAIAGVLAELPVAKQNKPYVEQLLNEIDTLIAASEESDDDSDVEEESTEEEESETEEQKNEQSFNLNPSPVADLFRNQRKNGVPVASR